MNDWLNLVDFFTNIFEFILVAHISLHSKTIKESVLPQQFYRYHTKHFLQVILRKSDSIVKNLHTIYFKSPSFATYNLSASSDWKESKTAFSLDPD